MGDQTAFDGDVIAVGGVLTDQHPVDFRTLGLAGCIDRLTGPLRQHGTAVLVPRPRGAKKDTLLTGRLGALAVR